MKTPLILLLIIAAVLGGSIFLQEPNNDISHRTDLPWMLTVNDDGSLSVFNLKLDESNLTDAIKKFGRIEDAALFQHKDGSLDLEVYFGSVMLGPIKAKIVTRLDVPQAELNALIDKNPEREGSPTGDWKFALRNYDSDWLAQQKLLNLSYIPGTRSLDHAFFLKRFGEPSMMLQENENAVSWFYPEKGLSILIDQEAYEVIEYIQPSRFSLAEGAVAFNKASLPTAN